jgi:glycosyltransferase involved in cell wall biosynthesis
MRARSRPARAAPRSVFRPDHPGFGVLRGALAHRAMLAVVTVTPALRDAWVRAGVPAERIRVWPDAVDLERFADPPPAEAARAAIGLPRGAPLAVYCGHLYEEKGAPVLIAAAHLSSKVAVHVVGGWPEDVARLRESARGCASVRFAGFVANSQVPLHLAAADVLVLPNSGRFPQARTTSPLKLFEYMAARRPIVASRIPAFEGLLRHGANAWLVAPDSPEALAEGIEHVLAEPSLGEQLAEQAWRDVQQYTWKRRAAEILASLEGAGGEGRRP